MRCDFIAEGVIKATKELQLDIPLVVRLKGTKEIEAKKCALFVVEHEPS
jgi:succinyl-CoA synthetase beta subunit